MYRQGQLPAEIGRSMGRPPDAMYALIYKAGGIKPAARVRSSRQSVAEREEISRGLAAGESCRAIAARLGRAPSTITREVNRNGGRDRYRALTADRAAWKAALRPKTSRLAARPELRAVVEDCSSGWSPEQIAGWLRREQPDDPEWWASREAIYRSTARPNSTPSPSSSTHVLARPSSS